MVTTIKKAAAVDKSHKTHTKH